MAGAEQQSEEEPGVMGSVVLCGSPLYEIPVAAVCNKVPLTGWLNTPEMYHLPALQHQGVGRALLPPGTLWEVLFSCLSQLLGAATNLGIPCPVAASLQCLPPSSHGPVSLASECVFTGPFYKDTSG